MKFAVVTGKTSLKQFAELPAAMAYMTKLVYSQPLEKKNRKENARTKEYFVVEL